MNVRMQNNFIEEKVTDGHVYAAWAEYNSQGSALAVPLYPSKFQNIRYRWVLSTVKILEVGYYLVPGTEDKILGTDSYRVPPKFRSLPESI